jgi:hypothetical protein
METRCPGCELILPDRGAPATPLHASQACWELYGELAVYTMARGRSFIHQHAVDAYQAQHAVRSATNIGPAFSLIGLCLALERGATGLQVQRAHMLLGQTRRTWPELEFPEAGASLTVRDVLNTPPGDARDAMLVKWCAAVWDSWSHAHAWTRQACDQLLTQSFSRHVRSR